MVTVAPGVLTLQKPDGGTVYVLGTAHTSQSAAEAAEELIRATSPSAVVLELCKRRAWMAVRTPPPRLEPAAAESSSLSSSSPPPSPQSSPPQQSQQQQPPPSAAAATSAPGRLELAGSLSSLLTDWTEAIGMQYSAFERVLGDQHAGGEFAAAAAEARRLGARVVLGDRDVALTQRRLRRLTPLSEVVLFVVGWEDGAWVRRQAELRMNAAEKMRATTAALDAATAASASASAAGATERDAAEAREEVRRLCDELRRQSEVGVRAAAPSYADAMLMETLRRFWCFELIDAAHRAKLRRAFERVHDADFDDMPLTPTVKQVMLDERDVVLAHALKSCEGDRVVGVVGKGHLDGIRRLWGEDTAALLPAALEEPPLPLGRCAVVAGAVAGVPWGLWRSRRFRWGLGAASLGLAGGAAWLVDALQRRADFYERSQREEAARAAG